MLRHSQLLVSAILCSITLSLLISTPGFTQSEAEHLSHHPELAAPANAGASAGQAAPSTQAAAPGMAPSGAAPPGGAAGMMQGMGEMMKKMGVPPKKDFYPSLVEIPVLTQERWDEIQNTAHARMTDGLGQLSTGLGSLSAAVDADNFALMQQALGEMREGIRRVESGLSAHRLLAEGEAPRNIALNWFKNEMNLASPRPPEEQRDLFGVTPFHLFTMMLLIAFALAMVTMYFFKIRRAAALFGRLDPDKDPPAGGAPPPSAPSSPTKPTAGTPTPETTSPGNSQSAPDGRDATAKIARRAEELWKARGQPIGSPEVDWIRAEAELGKPAELPTPSAAEGGPNATAPPPMIANWRGKLRVSDIVTETSSVKTFRLLPASNDRFLPFTFVPGQFLNVAFWIGGAKMNRSYSISSSPTQREYVDLTIRREPRGAVSRHTNDLLKVGDQIEASGPVGKFTFDGTEADSIVLISAGVGITPMVSIARYLTERRWAGDIFFVYTCHTPADFIFADEVAALQRLNPKLRVAVTISKTEGTDWKGSRGRITKEWLMQTVPGLASRRIHLCGPPSMMESTKAILAELGVPADRLKTEAFGATKPAPATAGTTAKPSAPGTGPLVTFSKSSKSAKIHLDLKSGDSPPEQTILELSEELGIGIEFSCRVGTCGLCKVKMTSGEVEMAVQDSLDAGDKTNNIILACQAKPKGEVTVEA